MIGSSKISVSLFLLVVLQAAVSASSLIVEIVAGRMLAPYVGMSLYTWTSVIAVVLAGFSVGHWIGGRVAEYPAGKALSATAWMLVGAALLTGCAVILLRFVAASISGVETHPVWTITVLSVSVFFLPSLFAGVPAPVLTHIAISEAGEKSGRALGAMFASGAVGAIAGTVLAGFVLVPFLGTTATLALVTIVYVVAAMVLFMLARRTRNTALILVGSVMAVLAAGFVSLRQPSPCFRESQYFCIRIIDHESASGEAVRSMVLDHLSHGTVSRDDPTTMYTEFTAMLDVIGRRRMGDQPFSAFFIGGGTYAVPRAWKEHGTGSITVVEIDPEVTRSAVDSFWLDATGLEIIHEDARHALIKREGVTYDVIVGDAFSDITVPFHLVTLEFFTLVRSRLADDGVFLMNVVDFPERLKALSAINRTLRSVFHAVEIWTEAVPPVAGQSRVFVLAAGKTKSAFDAFAAGAPQSRQFAVLSDKFTEQVLDQRSNIVLTDDFSPIDRLLATGLGG